MRHRESDMQISCIRWFKYQYPAYSMLIEHPKNEGMGDRRRGIIAKAEGVQPGVADIILHVPSYKDVASMFWTDIYHSLAIEMKTKTGRQLDAQKRWQRLFEAAGGLYVIVRSIDEFQNVVNNYMSWVPQTIDETIKKAHKAILDAESEEALKRFKYIVKPKIK